MKSKGNGADDTHRASKWRSSLAALVRIARSGIGAERLAELAKADSMHRVIVTPCGKGESVFYPEGGKVVEEKVEGFWVDVVIQSFAFPVNYLGASIFLTEDEAKRELENKPS